MSSNPKTEQSETMDLATAQRVEQEKMTRRAALRKMGFGAGMAAFALLGVDDLARMVGKRMERMANDNKVAEQVAKEFQNAGIVMAGGPIYPYSTCQHCSNQYFLDNCYCSAEYGPQSYNANAALFQVCSNQANTNNNNCMTKNCFGDEPYNNNGPYCPPTGLQPPQGCSC